jgi:hemerythrin-like domain-containing protein
MPTARDFRMNTAMHGAFQRELERVSRALDNIDLADAAAVAGLRRRFEFFTTTLTTHHTGEDTYLWPPALAKADPEEKVVLTAMEAEHEALAAALEHACDEIGALSPGADRAAALRGLADLQRVLAGHCAHEERDGVPIVAKYATDDDIVSLMRHARSAPDADLVLAWVCDGAPADQASAVWQMMPPVVRTMVRRMSTRKYDRFTAECGV